MSSEDPPITDSERERLLYHIQRDLNNGVQAWMDSYRPRIPTGGLTKLYQHLCRLWFQWPNDAERLYPAILAIVLEWTGLEPEQFDTIFRAAEIITQWERIT